VIASALAAALNHVLAQHDWARARLAQHAGCTLELATGGPAMRFAIDTNGCLHAASAPPETEAEAEPDARIALRPATLLMLPLRGREVFRDARTSGDAELINTLFHLAGNLEWDVEADLARVFGQGEFGNIAAVRMTRGAAQLRGWAVQGTSGLQRSLAEYLTQETDLLPARAEVDAWLAEVDRLRDDGDRLEARLGLLEQRKEPSA
jgi:ubiquinone biosynthesis protein UbiJ